MKLKLRKVLALIIVIITLVGWYFTVFGVGQIKSIKDVMKFGLDINGGVYVVMEADTELTGEELKTAMNETRAALNRRVNSMGLSEATVSLEGDKRIRIEMPGVKDAEEAINQIGRTAQLRFLLADGTEVLTGNDVKDAGFASDSDHGGYKIILKFTGEGTKKFTEATAKAYSGQVVSSNEGISNKAIMIMLDQEIITAPNVENGPITQDSCEITRPGGMPMKEASTIASLIRAGALPLSLNEITSSVQTATIGEDALAKSVIAGVIGLVLVFVIMFLVYRMLGLMANIALALYVLLVLWIMAGIGSVLTLPGIAAIILSIGMAVDANVIIFSRIKEEIAKGKTTRVAVSEGFRHAVVTVLDAQITTLIAAIVLYEIGSTSVKGFAITLMIGIVVSIFTAVVISQILIGLLAESKKFSDTKHFTFGLLNKPEEERKQIPFIKNRKIFYVISAVVIIVGLGFGILRGFNYGIDFTGGTMIHVNMGKTVNTAEVADEIKSFDLNPSIVLAGSKREEVIIKTIKALDNDERVEVVKALNAKYGVDAKDIMASEQFGPTVGRELKTNAVKSVLIASAGMLLYIIFRFKSWKYGVSSIMGLLHDVLVMLAIYGLFGITINNPFIAGILTVVGYSINDTIVIFDRIRENRMLYKKETLEANIDRSINQTLSRSLMTSLTTLLCMIPLTIMVSTSIREFVIPLMIGVTVGTYSSIFLCSPLLYETSKGDKRPNKYIGKTSKKAQA